MATKRPSDRTTPRWILDPSTVGRIPTGDGDEAALRPNDSEIDPRLDWLYEQIRQLNELDRSLTLLLLDGFSYKEMADALGMSETNVGVRIHRIKAYLTAQSTKESKHAT